MDTLLEEGYSDVTVLDLAASTLDQARSRLGEPADRAAYHLANLEAAVPVGGFAVIATFGPEGPERCSGLPVVRYSPEFLQTTLGTGFEQVAVEAEEHRTPGGKPQQFVGCLFRRV